MRKQQKRQVKEVVRLLGNVHEGIRKAIEAGKREEAMGFLARCQESAIDLGEMIEEVEGEGVKTIPLLENYCEKVYEIYEALDQGRPINGQKAGKILRKALVQAENSIKTDIRVRREVVFLPYKASMWDSLESVWKAADEDPDCDAYVIPIPYYTKNQDGSFRKEYYEGELYPDYVPVTRYEEYDFAGRQPDMIFIHNPYDNNNYLTSVHPFFYSKNLKQFTEKLIYIPYFILGEIEPEDKKAVEGMSHFCTVPGVLYADKVIVQSERMRQVYVNVMTEFTKGMDVDRKYWEEKILGLGSPKTDKALSTHKEDVEVPDEWLKIIEKPDGSWKTIIFYNTSITALLQNGERMFEKMREVFRVFRENREETALLWRPHPLIRVTIEAMRPHLWEEYEEIVKEYRKAEWGIYDDTADVDRAIALCDGYYGDSSSLVKLCQEARKPVMIQDMEKRKGLSERDFRTLWFDGAHLEDNELWFCAGNFNALVKANICTGETKVLGRFPGESLNEVHLYRQVLKAGNQLIFIPAHARHIAVYNIEEGLFKTFRIGGKEEADFYSAIHYGDYVWLFGIHGKNILSFHLTTGKIEKYQSEEISEDSGYVPEPILEEGTCYVPIRNSNQILELVIDTGNMRLHSVGEKKKRYNGIVPIEKEKLLIATDGKLTCWKKDEGILWERELLYEDGRAIQSTRVGNSDHFIWILPKMQGDEVAIYDHLTGKTVSIKMHYAEKKTMPLSPGKYTTPFCLEGRIYIYCFTDEMLHIVDMKDGAECKVWIGLEKNEIQRLWKEQMEESKGILWENQLYVRRSLNNYLPLIISRKNTLMQIPSEQGYFMPQSIESETVFKKEKDCLKMEGEKIYNNIKRC